MSVATMNMVEQLRAQNADLSEKLKQAEWAIAEGGASLKAALERQQALAAALEEHANLIRDLQQHHLADKKGRRESNRMVKRLFGISHISTTASLYKRDLIKQAEAYEGIAAVGKSGRVKASQIASFAESTALELRQQAAAL